VTRAQYLETLEAAVRTAIALLRTNAALTTDEAVSAACRMHSASFRDVRFVVQARLET